MRKRKKKRKYLRGFHSSMKLLNSPAHYRSGWELKYMQWLDINDDVLNYSYEPIKIV